MFSIADLLAFPRSHMERSHLAVPETLSPVVVLLIWIKENSFLLKEASLSALLFFSISQSLL